VSDVSVNVNDDGDDFMQSVHMVNYSVGNLEKVRKLEKIWGNRRIMKVICICRFQSIHSINDWWPSGDQVYDLL